jgi:hypothetical protein
MNKICLGLLYLLIMVPVSFADTGKAVSFEVTEKISDKIVGLELSCDACELSSMPHIPAGWEFNINNNAANRLSVKGDIEVGAAAIGLDELNTMFSIKKLPGFNMDTLKYKIYTTKDFSKTKDIIIDHKHLIFK